MLHTVSTFWGGHFHIRLAEHSQRSSFHVIQVSMRFTQWLKACEQAWLGVAGWDVNNWVIAALAIVVI